MSTGTWQQAAQRNCGKPTITQTSAAVRLLCVVSTNEPFGWGFPNDTVNSDAKDALKKITCVDDGFTWLLKWWKEQKLWAMLKMPGQAGYCTLDKFLENPGLIALLNNSSLIKDYAFVVDSLEGRQVEENEALEIASQFDPTAEPEAPRLSRASASNRPASQRRQDERRPHRAAQPHGKEHSPQAAVELGLSLLLMTSCSPLRAASLPRVALARCRSVG